MIAFFLVGIPLTTLLIVPRIAARITGRPVVADRLLVAAAAVSALSWLLPSPLIDGQGTQFSTHVVGGGVYCGLVWRSLTLQTGGRPPSLLDAVGLFAFTSALGVAIEIFELMAVRIRAIELALTDTSWDLLANTLGAALFLLGERAYLARSSRIR